MRSRIFKFLFIVVIISCQFRFAIGQSGANYDESKVLSYKLPPLLVKKDASKVKNAQDWERNQRPYFLELFKENVYGRIPGAPTKMHFKVLSENKTVLNGKATRKQVKIWFNDGESGPSTTLLMYLPNNNQKVPVFIGLNFEGNHTVDTDTGIIITDQWLQLKEKNDSVVRGKQSRRWPIEEIVDHGYGIVTAWYYDFEADNVEGWKTGVRTTLKEELSVQPDEWGAIAVWGWGLSRIMDYLEKDSRIDSRKVIVTGHSRLGKAALWAAANDLRFAMVISNNSGEGGAALSSRNFGETIKDLNTSFPHWFIQQYKSYNNNVKSIPFDQHMVLSLIAPRPLYVASASEDLWADPKGEFLSAKYTSEVYNLYGKKGIPENEMPAPEKPVGETVRYHVRTGKHDILLYDWLQYIRFADAYLK